jgi:hypothetical protein
MSYSFDRLAALIRTELNTDIIGGDVFIFLNKSRPLCAFVSYREELTTHIVHIDNTHIEDVFSVALCIYDSMW